jgi:hypothetical protein
MKNAALLLLSIIFLASCSKSSSSGPYFMTAKINGAPFNGTYAYSDSTSWSRTITGNLTQGSSGPSIVIELSNLQLGTYSLATPDSSGVTGLYGDASVDSPYAVVNGHGTGAVLSSNGGSLNITEITGTTIRGTFNFTYPNGNVVTDGSFYAKRTN